jgi:tetratricopeptide (TPR) repeat protein
MDQSRRKTFDILISVLLMLLSTTFGVVYAANKTPAETARQQANNCDWPNAILSYSKAMITSPKDASLVARRGYAYGMVGNFKQAFADFDTAIKIDSNCFDAYALRARINKSLWLWTGKQEDAERALKLVSPPPKELDLLLDHATLLSYNGKDKEADVEFKQVLAKVDHLNDLNSLILAARAHRSLKEYKEATDHLSKAIKMSPNTIYLYEIRGDDYMGSFEVKKAETDFHHGTVIAPSNPIPRMRLGYCKIVSRMYDEAIKDFDKALSLYPRNGFALSNRGLSNHELGKHKEAVKDYSDAIALDSTYAENYRSRADNYGHLKEWERALQDTKKAISLNPKYTDAYLAQAWVFHNTNRYPQAIETYNKAIEIEPQNAQCYFSRGMCHRENKQYRKAINDLTIAIKLNPKNPIFFCARGSAYVSDFKYEHAIFDCNNSLKLNSRRTHPLLSRGIAYAQLGNYKSALMDFDEAIKKFPEYGEAYYERGKIYRLLKYKDLGKSDLQKAIEFGHEKPEAM